MKPVAAGKGPITLLSFGHAFVDIYQGSVAALVPYFVLEREYTYAAAGVIVLAGSLASSVVQPLFGVLVDRWTMRWAMPVSTIVAGVGVGLVGVSDAYWFTLLVVGLSGVGVAAYHPAAAGAARAASASSHTGMSWFSLGGNVGFAVAPLMVISVMAAGGLQASPLLAIPALLGAALCLAALRGTPRSSPMTAIERASLGTNDWSSFLKLSAAIVCRSIVFVSLSAFIALYVVQRVDVGSVGAILALFVLYFGGAFGTILGGRLANRWQRVTIVRWSYILTIFAVAGIVFVPGPAIYMFVAATSMGLYVPFSLHITLGQDYLRRRVGTASGVTLGLTVSVGGLISPLIGAIADASTLQFALAPLIVFPAIAWAFLRTLKEPALPGAH